jgi:phage tail-like protein
MSDISNLPTFRRMQPQLWTDQLISEPLNNGFFRVQIGKREIGISSISPLQLSDPTKTEPDQKQTIILKRAIDRSQLFYAWRRQVTAGLRDRRPVRILHLDRPGEEGFPVNVFTLLAAQPIRWTGPSFDALNPDLAFEEIELSYASLLWIQLERPITVTDE